MSLFDAEHRIYNLAFDVAAVYEQDEAALSPGKIDPAQNADAVWQLDAIVSKLGVLMEALQNLRPT